MAIISQATLALLLVIAAAACGVITIWAMYSIARRPHVGAWCLALAYIAEVWFVAAPRMFLGLYISSTDAAAVAVALAAAVRWIGGCVDSSRRLSMLVLWWALGALIFLSAVRGLINFGSKGGVEVRESAYFWIAGLYFASFRIDANELRRLWHVLRFLAFAVAAVAIYRWVGLKVGFVSYSLVALAGASNEYRAVGAGATLVIACGGIAFLAAWFRESRPLHFFVSVCMLGLVLVLQHRSVWITAALAVVVLLAIERRNVKKRMHWLVIGGVLVSIVGVVVYVMGGMEDLAASLSRSYSSAFATDRGTQVDRYLGWSALLSDWPSSHLYDMAFGKAYGAGFERYVLGRYEDYAPHNFYVLLLLRVGVFGLLVFIAFSLIVVVRLLRTNIRAQAFSVTTSALIAVAVSWFAYYMAYQANYLQGAVYGVAISLVAACKASRRTATDRATQTPGTLQHVS